MHELKVLDLGVVVTNDNQKELVGSGKRISEIYMMDLNAGSVFWLRVGEANPLQPISRPFSFEPDGDDEANRGLYYSNPIASPGVLAYIVVVYGKAQLSPVMT